ncbi:hypothetical protein H2203_006848 [Taxawa tesnikishii (nom. ined.)]|nr:hypothetical protein H2203_006848 [Dothideales sp. JES 119]
MKTVAAVLALAGAVAALPQGVTSAIAPQATAPAGCQSSYSGTFQISVVNVSSSSTKRDVDMSKRQDKALTISLNNGVLTDDQGRTGYIAANNQFQFDKPAQTGAIYTAGWSVCSNGTLALGDSAIFYQCLSGTFYNLYDESTGDQCSEIYIDVIGSGSTVSSAADGQATAASASGVASQLSDGQVTASAVSSQAVSQISDGQIQATTAATANPVSQISDGQIQATTGTAAPVTQISDGQIQATTGSASQVTAAPVTQISDGQIQATTGTASPVTQISDGQIQAPTNGTGITTASPTVQAFTGAAALPTMRAEMFGLAGAALAAVALL